MMLVSLVSFVNEKIFRFLAYAITKTSFNQFVMPLSSNAYRGFSVEVGAPKWGGSVFRGAGQNFTIGLIPEFGLIFQKIALILFHICKFLEKFSEKLNFITKPFIFEGCVGNIIIIIISIVTFTFINIIFVIPPIRI